MAKSTSAKLNLTQQTLTNMPGSKMKDNKRPHLALSPESPEIKLSQTDLRLMIMEALDKTGLSSLHEEMQKTRSSMQRELKDIKDYIQELHINSEEAIKMASESNQECQKMRVEIECLEQRLKQEEKARIQLEYKVKRRNIRIYGIPEVDSQNAIECSEHAKTTIMKIMQETMKLPALELEECYRLGPKLASSKFPRPILVTFVRLSDRMQFWKNRISLKGSKIILKEDLPIEMETKVRVLTPILQEARRKNLKANIIRDQLYINGNKYTTESLDQLPGELKPENISTVYTGDAVFFYSRQSPLSNFYTTNAGFIKGDVFYNCVEQFYCSEKAAHFKDEVAKEKIMGSADPLEQKRTKIKNYSPDEWRIYAPTAMKEGLHLKFKSNEHLKKLLKDTGSRTIVEANPYDSFWGVGMAKNDPNINDKSKWGKNLLGQLLMEIRSEL